MRRHTRRKMTSKGTYKRSYKRTSKRIVRKQSGGIDMKKLKKVIKQRSTTSALAAISAKKAEEFKKQVESFY